MNAYWKDIFRTILKEKKRLIALMVIAALGVTMMCGLKASCDDLRQSADTFFDAQHLHDLSIVSTLGLTSEDVQAIERIDGVEKVEGEYAETLTLESEKGNFSADVKTISEEIDQLFIIEGRLPEQPNEMVVTKNTLETCGIHIGDTVNFKEASGKDETVDFNETMYTITGTVIDATSVINPEGTTAYRDESCTTPTGFVLKSAVCSKVFTSVNVILSGTEELNAFSDEYSEKVKAFEEKIKTDILKYRENVRTITIVTDAQKAINEGTVEAQQGFSKAENDLNSARNDLDQGWSEYESGASALESESQNALAQITASRQTIEENRKTLEAGEAELNAAQEELDEAYAKHRITKRRYNEAKAEIDAKRQEIEDGKAALDTAEKQLNEEEKRFYEETAAASSELETGRSELMAGEATLAKGYEDYLSQKAETEAKLADGQAEISEIEPCRWYIRERTALNGYSAISSDADCIEAIGTVFPVLFLLVAVLISLTTITRMIEENRGNIGTYKGLGYSNREIQRKYLIYAGIAAGIGGILGNFLGYVVLPEIIIIIFKTMYLLPKWILMYDPVYGITGILLFVLAICGATWFSCRSTLKLQTAELMRPKAPKSGKKILLERIPFIWKRLSFLSKVTARNLFRYKKRLLMTIFGIMGCTALLICGFSIKNTVTDLRPNQYEDIIQYDVMAVTSGGDDQTALMSDLEKDDRIETMMPLQISSADIINDAGESLSVQLFIIPDNQDISPYMNLTDIDGETLILPAEGMAITENAGSVLGFKAGDYVYIQNLSLNLAEGEVKDLVTYYLGNVIFMKASAYYQLYPDGDATPNGVLINLKSGTNGQAFAESLEKREGMLSSVSTQELMDTFGDAFTLINMVVYVVIVLAGALAFVVLFTLSTTNISERERELATIKVLGFVNREVYHYVNKETLILTGIGILFGLPFGKLMSQFLGIVLKLPSIVYRPSVHLLSYFLAAGISFLFALIVNLFTNPVIRKIDPVTALKSVE